MLNSTKVQYLTASLMAWEMPTSNMMMKSNLYSNVREKTLNFFRFLTRYGASQNGIPSPGKVPQMSGKLLCTYDSCFALNGAAPQQSSSLEINDANLLLLCVRRYLLGLIGILATYQLMMNVEMQHGKGLVAIRATRVRRARLLWSECGVYGGANAQSAHQRFQESLRKLSVSLF